MKKHKTLIIILSPVLVFLFIWGCSLARCEMLTLLYGNELNEAYEANPMFGDLDDYKVIDYSGKQARVYYISSDYSHGDTLTYIKENGEWKYDSWDTFWSTIGNADNYLWPYWFHFFYVYNFH